MLTLPEINKAIKLGDFAIVNDTVKRYGNIVKDINIDSSNTRYTLVSYRNRYFGVKMQHGEVLAISNNKEIVNDWQYSLI